MFNLSKIAFIQARNRATEDYVNHAEIPHEIADRLLERLDYIKLEPKRILDLGCATGYSSNLLHKRYKKTCIIALDPAYKMTQCVKNQPRWFRRTTSITSVTGWYNQLPFADQSIDLIFSNLSLHWQADWPSLAHELNRILSPEGLLLFSVPGPDTLKELRATWAKIDENPHVLPFVDMHDIGDSLLQSKFDDPVMDMELLTIKYPSVTRLFEELRGLGCKNALQNRLPHVTGKKKMQHMMQTYPNERAATLEVIYGHAWKSEDNAISQLNESGEIAVPIRVIKRR